MQVETFDQQKFDIAVAPRRTTKAWKNITVTWDEFLERIREPIRTGETMAEYKAMPKAERDARKDQGGFVGGYLKEGIRKKGYVDHRSMICLDADNIPPDVDFQGVVQNYFKESAYALYTTHSHTPEKPRFRIIVPLSRAISEEEYEPIARYLANDIGIDYFDPTTYEAHRLMYWPCASRDGEYVHYEQGGTFCSPDDIEHQMHDWRDASAWPVGKTETVARKKAAQKLGDPREKPGLIGYFCQAYTIEEAIAAFIPKAYTKVDGMEHRYTYTEGSTTGGMIVYDDGLHAYSHHATDPISGKDVNAFDLVRLHKFGALDEDAREDTPVNKLPSYVAMTDLCQKDEKVRDARTREEREEMEKRLAEEGITIAGDAKEDAGKPVNTDWMKKLHMTKQSEKYIVDAYNFLLILTHDPRLRGMAGYNEFSTRVEVLHDLPWRKHCDNGFDVWTDADAAQLRNFISNEYKGLTSKTILDDAFTEVTEKNRFHPVKDWWKTLSWDGKPRVRRILIDYLGAPDNAYTEEVTEKFFKASVARIQHPGAKFDQCLVLMGDQGIGKSTMLARMAGKWFQDTMPTIKGKDAMDALQGHNIIEMGEMQAGTKAENEEMKAFLSRQDDKYRRAYGHYTEPHPRQCIFAATTNEHIFLRDRTGGRRFWIIDCQGKDGVNPYTDFTPEIAAQCWAELLEIYKKDKSLKLSAESEKLARELQEAHTEGAERLGLIQSYLDMLLPKDWELWDIHERQSYIAGSMEYPPDGVNQRKRVCSMEIWCECLGNSPQSMRNIDAREINTIMSRMRGWKIYEKSAGQQRFKLYGRQRTYVRDEHFSVNSFVNDSDIEEKTVDTNSLNDIF